MESRKSPLIYLKQGIEYHNYIYSVFTYTNNAQSYVYTHTDLIDIGSRFDEITNNHILSIETSQMKWCVAIGIHLIHLCRDKQSVYGYSFSGRWHFRAYIASTCVYGHGHPGSASTALCCSCHSTRLHGGVYRPSCPYSQPQLHWPPTTLLPPDDLIQKCKKRFS